MTNKIIKFNNRLYKFNIRDRADESVVAEIFVNHDYKLADKVIASAQNAILDVGAHFGAFAVYCRALNPKVPIYCFEPEKENFKAFKNTAKINHFKNIIINNSAIGTKDGMAELKLSVDTHNHSLLINPENINPETPTQKVNVSTLDHVIKKYELTKIDLLKLDCEGAEFAIIKNLDKETFTKINNIIMEYHDFDNNRHNDLKNILISRGYKVEDYPSHFQDNLGFLWCQR